MTWRYRVQAAVWGGSAWMLEQLDRYLRRYTPEARANRKEAANLRRYLTVSNRVRRRTPRMPPGGPEAAPKARNGRERV